MDLSAMMSYISVIGGFIVLIKGADLLVKGASAIARRLKVTDLTIGLTVVAFGTSAPELSVNATAALNGTTDIAIANVLGSNIANIFLILGVAALIMPLKVTSQTVWREIPMNLMATVALAIAANDVLIDGQTVDVLSRADAMILLCFFAIFLYYTISGALLSKGDDIHVDVVSMPLLKATVFVVIGLTGLIVGGGWIVSGATVIAKAWGVSESIIGLTIVAIGTSLPELATSSVAAYRGNADIAVGNVVGSNIFNTLFILGISALIRPLPLAAQANRDICVVLISGLLLFAAMFTGRRNLVDRWEGGLLLLLYAGYIALLAIF